jgi:hypothetical protein
LDRHPPHFSTGVYTVSASAVMTSPMAERMMIFRRFFGLAMMLFIQKTSLRQ